MLVNSLFPSPPPHQHYHLDHFAFVGESVIEESSRIKCAFEFVANLTKSDLRFNGEEIVIDPFSWEMAEWALSNFQNPPYYLRDRWPLVRSDILTANPDILEVCVKLLEEK
jgi:hypothetical protein